jgi:hypothetical protein
MITALSEMMERFTKKIYEDNQLVPMELAYCPLDDDQFSRSGQHPVIFVSRAAGAPIDLHRDDSLKPGQLRAIGKFNFGSGEVALADHYYVWRWENEQYTEEINIR